MTSEKIFEEKQRRDRDAEEKDEGHGAVSFSKINIFTQFKLQGSAQKIKDTPIKLAKVARNPNGKGAKKATATSPTKKPATRGKRSTIK